MEKILDGVKYNIIPIPPHLSPYNRLLGDLLRKKPETVEAAETTAKEIKKAMDTLFAETVTPTPKPEHQNQLFNALTKLTSQVLTEAGLFREDPGPDTLESGTDGPDAAQKTE